MTVERYASRLSGVLQVLVRLLCVDTFANILHAFSKNLKQKKKQKVIKKTKTLKKLKRLACTYTKFAQKPAEKPAEKKLREKNLRK